MALEAKLTTSNPPLWEPDPIRETLPPTTINDDFEPDQGWNQLPAWEQPSVSNAVSSNMPEIKVPAIQSFEVPAVKPSTVPEAKTLVEADRMNEPVTTIPNSTVSDVQPIEVQQPASPFEYETAQMDSVFQGAVYGSFVLICSLAILLAILLSRKAVKVVEARFSKSLRILALALVGIALNALLCSGLFAVFWNQGGASIPLLAALAIWVLIGPAVAIVLDHLLTPEEVPQKRTVLFDVCVYALIFVCATVSLVPGTHQNVVFASSLLSVFLFIIPFTRYLVVLRSARANHPELLKSSDQVLVYALLILPALLPLFALGNACGLSNELTLFLFNFVAFNFILVVGFAIIASADDMITDVHADQSANQTAKASVAPTASQSQPAASGLNVAPQATQQQSPVRSNAPVKPNQKPAVNVAAAKAVNAPSSIKAPVKPKKRF